MITSEVGTRQSSMLLTTLRQLEQLSTIHVREGGGLLWTSVCMAIILSRTACRHSRATSAGS
jgi:hypothetical protein